MKIRNCLILCSTLVALLLSTPVSAQNDWFGGVGEPAYNQPGVYVYFGGSTGIDMEAEDHFESRVNAGFDLDDGLGFKAKLGYRPGEWWSGELEVEYLTGMDADVAGSSFGELEYTTVTANAKLILPFDSFQPFALVGLGVLYADYEAKSGLSSDTESVGVALRMGGGIDFYIIERVALVLDISYVLPFGSVDNLDYLSIGWGLQYKF